MPNIVTPFIFLGLAVLFAVLATREYFVNDHHLTVAGKNWRWMAIVFGVVATVLLYSN